MNHVRPRSERRLDRRGRVRLHGTLSRWGDQPVVAVVAEVEHAATAGGGVAEEQERQASQAEPFDRLRQAQPGR